VLLLLQALVGFVGVGVINLYTLWCWLALWCCGCCGGAVRLWLVECCGGLWRAVCLGFGAATALWYCCCRLCCLSLSLSLSLLHNYCLRYCS
jgi:hypothetical protein